MFFHNLQMSSQNYDRMSKLKKKLKIDDEHELMYRALLALDLSTNEPGKSAAETESVVDREAPETAPEPHKPDSAHHGSHEKSHSEAHSHSTVHGSAKRKT